jgi:PKD repeat protein
MMRLVCIAGATACCLLVGNCGTYRALIGDYADDYVIENIRPLAGVSGEEVTFKAHVCENAGAFPMGQLTDPSGLLTDFDFDWQETDPDVPSIIWDFGGGAVPNVAYEAQPQVTLRDGLRSPYDCSLTIRYGCEEDEVVSATFSLAVAPLSVLTVTPLTGIAGGTATFSAVIGTGNVTGYAWDFGGACSPSGSNEANPVVTFDINAEGFYPGRLVISNNYEAFEFPFTLTVIPEPEE